MVIFITRYVFLMIIFYNSLYFAKAQGVFQEYLKNQNTDFENRLITSPILEQDKDYKNFKRMEYFYGPRMYPDKEILPSDLYIKEYTKWNSQAKTSFQANWKYIGSDTIPHGSGAGRLNCLAFDPTNPDILWVGAPEGGLWKSTDAGLTWQTNTDFIPNIGVTSIVINHQNPQIMYVATGDGYGYPTQKGIFWGGKYSNGIIKSIDGGFSWIPTAFQFSTLQKRQIYKLTMDASNPDILLASTNDGLYRTINGGNTWNKVINDQMRDVKHHPTLSNVVFATSFGGKVYRSTNHGQFWFPIKEFSANTVVLGMTKASDSCVYAWTSSDQLYRSYDLGQSWYLSSSTWEYPNWYYQALAVSPIDENIVFTGCIKMQKSTTGGYSWNYISTNINYNSPNFVHADTREILFHPNYPNILYSVNDGGLFMSPDEGLTWFDLSRGLHIMQCYRFSNSKNNPNMFLVGAQDNSQNLYKDGIWKAFELRDGVESAIHPNDDQMFFAGYQNGKYYRTLDGGISFTEMPYLRGNWVSSIAIDNMQPNIVYASAMDANYKKALMKSTDFGNTWVSLTDTMIFTAYPDGITICKYFPNNIYMFTGSYWASGSIKVFKSSNGGGSFEKITSNLPITDAYPTYLIVDEYDPDKLWITFSGYDTPHKVYKTINGGNDWINISLNLPQVPVNCIIKDASSYNGLYVGTDVGVFFICDTLSSWISYNDGLPNVIVNELEIVDDKLRAATYGRGVWETPIIQNSVITNVSTNKNTNSFKIFPTITQNEINILADNALKISIYTISGEMVLFRNNNDKTISLNHLNPGIYIVKLLDSGNEVYQQKIIKID